MPRKKPIKASAKIEKEEEPVSEKRAIEVIDVNEQKLSFADIESEGVKISGIERAEAYVKQHGGKIVK